MTSSKKAKAEKKAAKARLKIEKKQAKSTPPPHERSVAERSAAAAERQVRLQRMRVVFAFLMFLVAATGLVVTWVSRSGADGRPMPTQVGGPQAEENHE